MINGCFIHIDGVGPRTEATLHERGYLRWEDCLNHPDDLPLAGERRLHFLAEIERSLEAQVNGDIAYLVDHFPPSRHGLILEQYRDQATFFDIETTGLSRYYHHPSVIVAHHRGEMHSFCHGENLDDFLELLNEAFLLVSFNGNAFDVPFIESAFNIPSVAVPHVDLRWIAYHRGLRGGLKAIERTMGFMRPDSIADVDGLMAVFLYHRWQEGDLAARERLLSYCQADVESLRRIAERLIGDAQPGMPMYSEFMPIVQADKQRLNRWYASRSSIRGGRRQ